MPKITTKDVIAMKKAIDRAILEDIPVRKIATLSEARGISKEAHEVLEELTQAEIDAMRSAYKRAREHGAAEKDLMVYGPIH